MAAVIAKNLNQRSAINRFYFETLTFLALGTLFLISGCGGSNNSGSNTTTPPISGDYQQKISIIQVTDSRVFFSVEVASGRYELYSADPENGTRVALTDFYSANNGLRPMGLNFDGSRIGYRADKDRDGTDELYTNLVDGSNEAMVTNAIGTSTTDNTGTTVHYNWQWLFGSTSLIFRSDPDADGIFEIQTAALNGGSLAEVSADLSVKCLDAHCWKTAATGRDITFVVESMNQNSEIEQNLYRVLSDGNGLQQLNQSVATDTRLHNWQWSANGLQLVYSSQDIGSATELNIVNMANFQVTSLNAVGLQDGVTSFQIAPDDSLVAYTSDGDLAGNPSLYSVLPDGTQTRQLIDTLTVADPVLLEWSWAPDASRIAYRADQSLAGVDELFTVAADGQFHRKMNPPMTTANSISANWQWSPDSQYLGFFADIETADTDDELYAAAADGSMRNRVNVSLSSNASLVNGNSQWTADSSRLVYQVVDPGAQTEGLYSVAADGSDQNRLNDELLAEESILENFVISPNSSRIAFQIGTASSAGLQISDVTGGNRVNVTTSGFAESPFWLPDSSRLIYVHRSDDQASDKLYSVLADGTGVVGIY